MRLLYYLCLCLTIFSTVGNAQDADSIVISKIYSYELEHGKAYDNLDFLCNNIGGRLSGSSGAGKAVVWAKNIMEKETFVNVTLQAVMVPHWVRNNKEIFNVINGNKKTSMRICSLGGSIPTPSKGITAKVIEVNNFESLDKAGKQNIAGKIVFFNTPLNQQYVSTFKAYGENGKFRYTGAQQAARYGAVASITRSLTLALDDHPHTGAMGYSDTIVKIPACAISTNGAEALSNMLKTNPDLEVHLEMNCQILNDTLSNNVIAEIKGTTYPDEIIVIGGHLDSWDTGKGANDDGSGVVQSMELINIYKALNIKPKRTIRIVLFMNEENGLRGAKKYAEIAKMKNEKHIAAIESDGGSSTPQGFTVEANDSTKIDYITKWKNLLLPYGLYNWTKGHAGSDINPLKEQGVLLIGLLPDTQRYFDYHHSEIDTFDKVNRRELHLGAAAMASLVYMLSEYGTDSK